MAPASGSFIAAGAADADLRFGAAPAGPARCAWPRSEEVAGPGWRLRLHEPALAGAPALTRLETSSGPAWVLGEIHRYGSSVGLTPVCASRFFADARPDPAALSGRFAILRWQPARGVWQIWTDRFGTLHLYRCDGPGGTAVSSYSPSLFGLSARRLDWSALASFFHFGYFAQDRTHYDDVRLLPPATRVELDGEGRLLSTERYWQWTHQPEAALTMDGAIAEFEATLRRVTGDLRDPGPAVLPLSGGLDSRTLAAFVDASVKTYAYGYTDDSIEIRLARQVAEARGLSFHGFAVDAYLIDRLPEVLGMVEGFQDVTQARQASAVAWLSENAAAVYAGHGGDVFCDSMGWEGPPEAAGPAVLAHAVKKLHKRGSDWLLANLCAPRLGGEDPETLCSQMVAPDLERLNHIADADFRIKALKFDTWFHRWTFASVRMYQLAAIPRLPFFDNDMADLFRRVPTELVRRRALQIEYLKRRAPELARVRWQHRNATLFELDQSRATRFARRVLGKLERLAYGAPPIRNWERQFLPPDRWVRLKEELLAPGRALHEFVEPAAVAALLDDLHHRRRPHEGYAVSMLLTFSAWLERFHRT